MLPLHFHSIVCVHATDTYKQNDVLSIQENIINHVEYTMARSRYRFDDFECYQVRNLCDVRRPLCDIGHVFRVPGRVPSNLDVCIVWKLLWASLRGAGLWTLP